MKRKEKLLVDIKQLSEELVETATKLGLSNEKTIALSQELDKLLNEYQRIK